MGHLHDHSWGSNPSSWCKSDFDDSGFTYIYSDRLTNSCKNVYLVLSNELHHVSDHSACISCDAGPAQVVKVLGHLSHEELRCLHAMIIIKIYTEASNYKDTLIHSNTTFHA